MWKTSEEPYRWEISDMCGDPEKVELTKENFV